MFSKISKVLNVFWRIPLISQLSTALQGALVRGARGVVSAIMAVLVANATAGTLFPREWGQVTTILLVGAVLAVDKWLRGKGLEETSTDSTVVTA